MTDTTLKAPVRDKVWLGPLLVLIGAASVGFGPIGLRLGLDTLGPQAIAFWRYLFATPMVFAILVLVHRRLPVLPNRFILLAGTFFALDIALWHWSLTMTTVANSTFILSLGNISVGLLAWIFLKEKLTRNWMVAVVVALVGALLLTQGGGVHAKGNLSGDLIAGMAALMVAFYMLCAKLARQDIGGLDALFWVTATEAGVQCLIVVFSGENFMPASSAGWRAPLMLAVLVQCVGQGFILAGLGRTPAAIAGVLMLFQPVTAAAISWQLFDEPLLALQILGGALILIGVALSQTGKAPQKVS